MYVYELKVGDRVMAEDGAIETIRHISSGMIRGHLNVTFRSGRWSELYRDDEIEIEPPLTSSASKSS